MKNFIILSTLLISVVSCTSDSLNNDIKGYLVKSNNKEVTNVKIFYKRELTKDKVPHSKAMLLYSSADKIEESMINVHNASDLKYLKIKHKSLIDSAKSLERLVLKNEPSGYYLIGASYKLQGQNKLDSIDCLIDEENNVIGIF